MNRAVLGWLHSFPLHEEPLLPRQLASRCSSGMKREKLQPCKQLPAASAQVFNRFVSLPQTLWESLLVAHQGKVLEILKNPKVFPLGLLVCRTSNSLQPLKRVLPA